MRGFSDNNGNTRSEYRGLSKQQSEYEEGSILVTSKECQSARTNKASVSPSEKVSVIAGAGN